MGKFIPLLFAVSFIFIPKSGADPRACEAQCRAQHADFKAGISTCVSSCWSVVLPPTGNSNNKKNDDKKADENQPTPTNSCRSDYERLKQECISSTADTASSCDENNSPDLKKASNGAQQMTGGGGDNAAVQQACGQAGGLSESAKSAMTAFRDSCSGALTICRSACAEFALFLAEPSCLSSLGMSQAQANSEADSLGKDCERHQAEVDSAEKSISNYKTTSAGSAACQMAAMGASSPQEAQAENEKKTFCNANPTYPGCANNQVANCNDPSQANNRVCVCSKNPENPMCRGVQNVENTSLASSVDSGSRLPTSQADVGGDIPNTPGIQHGPRPNGSGGEGIDGRQGGAAVGNATNGSAGGGGLGGGSEGGQESLQVPVGSGAYGGSGGARMAGAGGVGSGYGGYAGRATANGIANRDGKPDLRQFLPGGIYDPRMKNMAGGVGKDGITGPHSSNWSKIQNRFQILKHTLEP